MRVIECEGAHLSLNIGGTLVVLGFLVCLLGISSGFMQSRQNVLH